jgi:3-oxoacyl-[acyl-carrier-protein] synthase III
MVSDPGRLMTAYLSDITVLAGDPVPLERVAGVPSELAQRLSADGLGQARVFGEAPWRMAADCVRTTLAGSTLVPDMVVYACEGRGGQQVQELTKDTARFLVAAGLDEVTLVGAGLNQCANLGSLLLSACSLVGSGASRTCLLATVDSVVPEDRVVNGDIGVFSDAAASALVSVRPVGSDGFQVLGIEHAACAKLGLVAALQDDQWAASAFVERIDGAMRRLAERTGVKTDGFTYVLANNYATSAIEVILGLAGVPLRAAYRGTASDYAHCFAADGLLNLDHMRHTGALQDGDTVLVLCTATTTWFLVALHYHVV